MCTLSFTGSRLQGVSASFHYASWKRFGIAGPVKQAPWATTWRESPPATTSTAAPGYADAMLDHFALRRGAAAGRIGDGESGLMGEDGEPEKVARLYIHAVSMRKCYPQRLTLAW